MMPAVARRRFLYAAGASLAVPCSPSAAESPDIPRSLGQLWEGYTELDRSTPLDVEVFKEWMEDDIVCRLVRYQVGVFKGVPSRVAAFYAFPNNGTNLPAILEMHGGGQSASLKGVVTYAKRGYASMSINWGGNKLNFDGSRMTYEGPQTDWGALDATHPPQRNQVNHFAGPLTPNEFTLDAVESPRNSNWFLVLMASRRAISFLEQQPEVDPARIGARGHSMGGKLTTDLAGIDKRVKAAVPSCGGSGDMPSERTDLPGGNRTEIAPLVLACISDNAYLPLLTCPVLWLSPTNDFHAHIDNMAWNWRDLPDERVRFSISPHLNHRHTDEHLITEALWFEEHLKGAAFRMPRTPTLVLDCETPDGVPIVSVEPDDSMPVRRVDIYYSVDSHGLTRFWRDAKAVAGGRAWSAACPVLSVAQPIFTFANVVYETLAPYRSGSETIGRQTSATFAISSRVVSVSPARLQAWRVKATDKPEREIDDGTRGWHDWYLLNWGHPPLWSATTRKLKDPKWRGPDGASLHFDIRCETDNQLVLTCNTNAWGAFARNKPAVDYAAVKRLTGSPDWQEVTLRLDELHATDPMVIAPMPDWRSVTEFSISPRGKAMIDGELVEVPGKAWRGPREIRNLRWVGGEFSGPEEVDAAQSPEEHQRNFNDAIRKSLEQEKLDQT